MTHRAQLAVLALLIVLLLVFALFPRQAGADAPMAASRIPASEFAPVGSAGSLSGQATPGAPFQPRTLPGAIGRQACRSDADAGCSLSARSAAPSPSASSAPPATPVRIPAPTERAVAVTGINAGRSPTASASPSTEDWTARPGTISGVASWFASPRGVSAAGPALRTALGPGWRGSRVRVTGPAGSAVTTLGDWMAADRLIDLDAPIFRAVCGALSRGICEAKVTW